MVTDILGDQIGVNDYVFFDSQIYVISKITAKMIVIQKPAFISRRKNDGKRYIYAHQCVKLPEDKVRIYLLKYK